ncbi:cysteine--tRNA ligase [Candidatus Woesearchaeota archaeon]|nr:cysteine--tRNA ligase [Candidatus Woesearchaeota archaeon]
MALRFYNTLTRKKQDFVPIKDGKAGIYSCGPTVYDYVHIGNLRAFMCSDILRRYLKYRGYAVTHVMNITDVDDKTIRDSIKKGISLKEHTGPYTDAFFSDLKTLNIEPVEHYPKATETIDEMVALVKKLLELGYAYRAGDGIYFSIAKFPGYGKLAGLNKAALIAGASKRVRSDEYDKDSAHDFVLWKFWDKADGDVFWETEIGKGRPGWHIECSAMSMKYLGETFDIHTGGIDLIFPHHQNEIAQSEAATKKRFVNYWLHNEYMLVDGEKMSKSLGNFYKLKDILERGYSPEAVRYLLMSSQYRQKLNFTFESLEAAEKAVKRFREFMDRLPDLMHDHKKAADCHDVGIETSVEKAKAAFIDAMDDDLNISGGLGVIFDLIREVNRLAAEAGISAKDAEQVRSVMLGFDEVLGVIREEKQDIPEDVTKIAEERKKARDARDWKTSDMLRDKIKGMGYSIEDTKEGYRLKRA